MKKLQTNWTEWWSQQVKGLFIVQIGMSLYTMIAGNTKEAISLIFMFLEMKTFYQNGPIVCTLLKKMQNFGPHLNTLVQGSLYIIVYSVMYFKPTYCLQSMNTHVSKTKTHLRLIDYNIVVLFCLRSEYFLFHILTQIEDRNLTVFVYPSQRRKVFLLLD